MTLMDESIWLNNIYINGWTSNSQSPLSVIDASTGEQITSVGNATINDVVNAAKIAKQAQVEWAKTTPEKKAAVLRKAGELFEEYASEIEAWDVKETGKIPMFAGFETHVAAQECFEAASLPTHPSGTVIPSSVDHWSFSRRKPVGVVSVISPFNAPLILSIRSVAPALALGNAVLLKPDQRTPITGGVSIVRIFEEAGLPQGLLHLLPGGSDIGEAVITAEEVNVVSFTGSSKTGKAVAQLAAQNLKRVHLELGGNSALVVLPGADVAKAASAGAFGSFWYQGQICMTTGRHIVHSSIYDEYVSVLSQKANNLTVGNPSTDKVMLGPIIDNNQLNRVDSLVQDSIAMGAVLSAGGTYENKYYRPTVLCNVSEDMPAYNQEVFGPVASVIKFDTIEEAIDLVNNSDYGLSLGILGDVGMAMQIADAASSGIVHINEQTVSDEAQVPFGGVKNSGNGSRFGGAEANIDAFTETQWLTVKSAIAPYPF